MPDTCDENCTRCSGEYCEQHSTDPCDCDVDARHAEPRRASGRAAQVFSPEEVFRLNNYQHSGCFHPFTCGSDDRINHPDGEGLLVATIYGWICPYCDYRQNWAHPWMKSFTASPLQKIDLQITD